MITGKTFISIYSLQKFEDERNEVNPRFAELSLTRANNWNLFSLNICHKYMLFTRLEVRIGKYFPRSQKRPEAKGRGTFL